MNQVISSIIGTLGTILVVGGISGIGGAICRLYHRLGATLIVADSDTSAFQPLQKELGGLELFGMDISKDEQVQNLHQMVMTKYGHLDHLVCLTDGPMDREGPIVEWLLPGSLDRSIAVNLTAPIMLTNRLLPRLNESRGPNTTVTFILRPSAARISGLPVHNVARAGLVNFVAAYARELGKRRIRINAILPGTVPLQDDRVSNFYWGEARRRLALGDLPTPEQIAKATLAVTHLMVAMTGQAIVVDAGQSLPIPYP